MGNTVEYTLNGVKILKTDLKLLNSEYKDYFRLNILFSVLKFLFGVEILES